MKKNHLTIILDAGFSANAGMPIAKEIDKRFDRDLREKLLANFTMEWFWIDGKDKASVHNGRLHFDCIAYSYVFNELVKRYVSVESSFIGYEDFYQFIIDNFKNLEWKKDLFKSAKQAILFDKPCFLEEEHKEYYDTTFLYAFNHEEFEKVIPILNYLIADILDLIPKMEDELIEIYKGFIDYIEQFEEVDIFTLNHDLLLEKVLDLNGLEYSKGFNTENSTIYCDSENQSVPVFNNTFNEKIRIHKLHGSLDFYKFRHYTSGIFTGESSYYMTTNHRVKHTSQRIDPETGERHYNPNVVPKFITGTNKEYTIENDKLFKKLFENFEEVINHSENLFISGYSFGDDHLNKKLKSKEFNYINQNPCKKYPFKGNGKNITSLNELKNGSIEKA